MKKFLIPAVALTLTFSCVSTSCIGSFNLTNRLLSWNNQAGDKFTNELIFFAFWILPVYEVCALTDVLVLNSIEFWSGNNPMAKSETIIKGADGEYLCVCDGRGYTITSMNDGSVVRFDFDADDDSWSYSVNDGENVTFLTFVDVDHVKLPGWDGKEQIVELTQSGIMAYGDYAKKMPLMANR